jgi:hypothetical protein
MMALGDELFNPEFEQCVRNFRFSKPQPLIEETCEESSSDQNN